MRTWQEVEAIEGQEAKFSVPATAIGNKKPVVLSENPIIAVLQRSLQRRGIRITALSGQQVDEGKMRQFVGRVFGKETMQEVGTLVTEALLRGDKEFPTAVRRAIKEADHLFNRDRELVLLDRAFRYANGDGEGLDVAALKKQIERRYNRGRPLQQHQWNRLRKALFLSKLPTGAPKNSDTKQRQSVY